MQTPLAQEGYESHMSVSPLSALTERGTGLRPWQGFLVPALCCFVLFWVLVN